MEKRKTSLFTQASLQPTAIGALWAKPSLPGPRPGLWPAHANRHAQHAHGTRSPHEATARAAPWQARHRLNDSGNPELLNRKWSPGNGLHMTRRGPRRGGREGGAHQRSHSKMARVDEEEAPVRDRRSG
jgi:hypothetical protein